MKTTKQEILEVSLELFSTKGFDATSLSSISSALSITKAALFKHFSSKDEILEEVVKMMDREDRERSEDYSLPSVKKSDGVSQYENLDKESFLEFALSQFDYWTINKKGREYRKFLSIERYNRPFLEKKWEENFVSGPMEYTYDVLSSLSLSSPRSRSFRLWGAMFLSYSLYDEGKDVKGQLEEELRDILEV